MPRLGPKAFEQCAGFLRITNSDNPLDARSAWVWFVVARNDVISVSHKHTTCTQQTHSAVHPESYWLVDKMAKDAKLSVRDLMHKSVGELHKIVDVKRYISGQNLFIFVSPFSTSVSHSGLFPDTVGLPTLNDILDELAKPGRDPRTLLSAAASVSGAATKQSTSANGSGHVTSAAIGSTSTSPFGDSPVLAAKFAFDPNVRTIDDLKVCLFVWLGCVFVT